MNRIYSLIKDLFLAELDRWNLWLPVAFGLGIAVYFLLPQEPFWAVGPLLFLMCMAGFLLTRRNVCLYCFFLALCFATGGFALIQTKANLAAAPRLSKNMRFVWVEGTVDQVELYPNARRLTLSDVFIDRISPEKTPKRVRIRANGLSPEIKKGDRIEIRANLMPPGLPTEPGGYAFCRPLWFSQIGATGYATGHPVVLQKKDALSGMDLFENLRQKIGDRIRTVLPPEQAGVVLPLVIGSGTSISQKTYNHYRDAGIAHVLSVSGLHMMLIAGLVFAFMRFFLTLFPPVALRINTKKTAAVVALIIPFLYLMISGLAVPAQRSYLMLFVVFTAVILDRQALSVRNVCWIGFFILLFKPESLITASFQLSFGAVLALICAYEALKKPVQIYLHKQKNKCVRWLIGLAFGFLITNIAAGLATSPIAVYHFYRYPTYGILGNFLTSSLFGILIMPLLLISVLCMPFGWDVYPLKAAGFFLDLVADITAWIAGLPKASVLVPALPTWGFACFILGGLWVCLWRTKIRLGGLVFLFIGAFSFLCHTTPDLFISQGGRLIGLQENGHFSFSTLNREKRTRQSWMERNGYDPNATVNLIETPFVDVKGYRIALTPEACAGADIAILPQKETPPCEAPLILDYKTLWNKGAHTLFLTPTGISVKNAADTMGMRLWHPNVQAPFLLDFFTNTLINKGKE